MRILTFDIEEWFHILDHNGTRDHVDWNQYDARIHNNIDNILELLDNTNQKATFFCLGWIAEKYPDIIKKINREGCDIGSHSYMHQLVYEQKRSDFTSDLDRSIKLLQDITGVAVKYYRAPGFSVTRECLWVFEEIEKLGIEIDCSVFPGQHGHGGLPGHSYAVPSLINYQGTVVKSLPMNTLNYFGKNIVFSGGGYFRLCPLWLLNKWFGSPDYIMTYFHPRDFDADQPRIQGLSPIRKFKSYIGLKSSFGKLKYILDKYKFMTVSDADKIINWKDVPIENIGF